MSLQVTVVEDESAWNGIVNDAGGHPLQLWGWGALKARYEWDVTRLLVHDDVKVIGSAQVLFRKLPVSCLAYIPRGPQAAEGDRVQVLQAIAEHVKAARKPLALTIEPDWDESFSPVAQPGKGDNGPSADEVIARKLAEPDEGWLTGLRRAGFTRSENTGLIPHTLIVDLSPDEDAILASFTSTTRQNVRKSLRNKEVRFGEVVHDRDLDAVLAINRATGERNGFAVHDDGYHRGIRDLMGGDSHLLAAWEGEEVVAFVWLVASARTAFELYGGVSPRGQKLRLNYGLKFYAMQQMKAIGVHRYDFNGLLNDGISDFKRQFAKHEDQLIGTWDKPLSPLYAPYSRALPVVRKTAKTYLPQAKSQVSSAIGKLRRK